MRSMNAVSSRISFGNGERRCPTTQLLLDVDVEVTDHDDSALGTDRLAAAAELPGLHVALEDVHAFLLVERDPGDLVEADHVVLGDEAAAPAGHVDEHVGDRRLAAGDEVRVRRYLLEEVRLARASGPELDGVVVPHDEGDHPQQEDVLLAHGQPAGLEADAAQQQLAPLVQREPRRARRRTSRVRPASTSGSGGSPRRGTAGRLAGRRAPRCTQA